MAYLRRHLSGAWLALPAYAVLAVVVFIGAWADPAGRWIGDDKDPKLFIWYLGWIPHALGQGHNPLVTDYLSYPPGVNLMWNSSIVFPALILWPVTAAFGPVAGYNVLITASVALSAWLGFIAARRFVKSIVGCLFAGFVYGFSPGIMAQALGHPHALIALFPPIVLILGHEILVVQSRSAWWMGGLLGLASALQLLTGEEVLATTALLAAIGAALAALLHLDMVRSRLPYAAKAIATAAVSFAIVAAYPLGVQFFGPQRVSGSLQTPDIYVSDLVGFIAPGLVMFRHGFVWDVARLLSGNRTEQDAYVGVPLLALFAIASAVGWRRPWVRWFSLATVCIAALSLGSNLHVLGRRTGFPLPWLAVQSLPLMGSALPSRLMLDAFLGIGIVSAGLWDASRQTGRLRWIAVGVLMLASALTVFPQTPAATTRAEVPSFFQAGGQVAAIPDGAVILVTPFSSRESTDAMYWQTVAGYRFRMPEGDAFTPGPYLGPHPSHIQASLDALDHGRVVEVTQLERELALRDLAAFGVRSVVAGPSPGESEIVRYLTDVIGAPPVETEGVFVWWRLPPPTPVA
ncbi:MAG TPA: hypothetical protein VEW68_10340 [Patescibacteria group bacterium]|nr:hypothetical protein [Patescibacteria group bacterium]